MAVAEGEAVAAAGLFEGIQAALQHLMLPESVKQHSWSSSNSSTMPVILQDCYLHMACTCLQGPGAWQPALQALRYSW
jgi:hypothetical protein